MTASVLETTVALEAVRILEDWIRTGQQFTCFNVTRELRRRGHDVRHQATLDLVHGLAGLNLPPFKSSDYGRFTASFTTASGHSDTAEVYRDLNDMGPYDPDFDTGGASYVPSTTQKTSNTTVSPVVAPPAPPPAPKPKATVSVCAFCNREKCTGSPRKNIVVNQDGGQSNTPAPAAPASNKRYGVDNRGRICVRNDLTKTLGVNPGERVFLQKAGGGVINILTSPPSDNTIGSLKVDKDGNIRVSRNLQRKAGAVASSFAMELKNGTVILTG